MNSVDLYLCICPYEVKRYRSSTDNAAEKNRPLSFNNNPLCASDLINIYIINTTQEILRSIP